MDWTWRENERTRLYSYNVSISENGKGDIAGVPMSKVFKQMVERENVIKYLLEWIIKIILTMKVKKSKSYNKPQMGEYSSGPLIQEAFKL